MKINIIKEPPEYYYRAKLVTWQEAVDYGKANGLELLSIEELCEIPREELMKIPGVLVGYRSADGSFLYCGTGAHFWSSNDRGVYARSRHLYCTSATVCWDINYKSLGFSAIYKVKEK